MNQEIQRPPLADGDQTKEGSSHAIDSSLPNQPTRPGSPSLRELGWIDAVALLALAALTLLFFWRIALTNQILAGLDVFAYFYPYRDAVSSALRDGQLPLWNPYLFMGAPLLANSQTAALYPLHWPLLWLSTPKQIAWSIVLHIWLAGAGAYLFARLVPRLRVLPSFSVGIVFALGGFLGAQVEHVNQLNASAWLPWLLLCMERAMGDTRHRWLAILAGGAVVALMLLAGHTQAAYIVLFGTGIYAVVRGWLDLCRPRWRGALAALAALVAMCAIGVLLAAGQLLPTLELSRLSVRSGGLPYNEAASFSLKPTLIFKAFLPPLVWEPPFSEYVAYVGLAGLVLVAIGIWAVLRQRRARNSDQVSSTLHNNVPLLVLLLLGVFLAFGAYNPLYYVFYKLIPGFSLFRAPARWLLLYAFAASVLAGIGLEVILRLKSWKVATAVALLVVVELLVAGGRLAYNSPTAPTAFDSMRTAPAHLVADNTGPPFRFLSLSDLNYDPGDLYDLQAMYGLWLPEEAVYDLVVATKIKEVLAFNLPLGYRLFSVDGYDGGLLPVEDYVTLERLFLAEEDIWPDGRLRQQLRRAPPSRLLSLLNVKHLVTDKTQDVWIDGVYYDLEHTMPLGQVTLADLPSFEATHIGIVSFLTGTKELANASPVAQVTITSTAGVVETTTLRAGEHTAEGLYEVGVVEHSQARVGHPWRDNELGTDYIAVLELLRPQQPSSLSVQSFLGSDRLRLRGLTLIDERTRTSRNLTVDPAYRVAHSGDVKIYENLTVLPRASIVHRSRVAADPETALSIIADPGFDPSQEVILESGAALTAEGGPGQAEITAYEPHRVEVRTHLNSPGYLVLADTYYPGWTAEVDGKAAPILKANLYFRAIALTPGDHVITFRFEPASVQLGLALSLAAWLAWAVAITVVAIRIGRKTPPVV